jgi:DNA-binding CsgD family transcriptional regulator/GAF domain-containing protein
MSVQIASLRILPEIYDLALTYCLALTESETGFIGLVNEGRVDMNLVAVKGFAPPDPKFFERFRRMPLRPSVFGIVITEGRPNISDDVENDPASAGQPPGHPCVRRFLGVPLRVSDHGVIGMIGVGNKPNGYGPEDERLLSTFANQVAVAIDNAMLHEHQQEMIARLQQLNAHLSQAEREQLIALERERTVPGRPDPSSSIRTPPSLNNSQQEILRLITEGLSNKEIASRIHLSENTVKSHIQEILRKLEARNRVQAAVRATKAGWV